MKDIFLIVASLITIAAIFPYARDILKGTTRPNIVSWITWALLTGIATAAAISAEEYITAIFTGSAVIETSIIVVLGLKYGYVKYTRFDVVCQVSALIGIILWQLFDSPTIGVVASVLIDFIGGIPTIRHAWQRPHEETWPTYALSAAGGALAILALTSYNWVSLTYAVYIVFINVLITSVIIGRERQVPVVESSDILKA